MKRSYKLALVTIIAALAVAFGSPAFAGLGTQDLSTLTPTDLANFLVGAGVTTSNVTSLVRPSPPENSTVVLGLSGLIKESS